MSRHCAAAKILLTACIYILANEMDINDSGCRAENTSCDLTGTQTHGPRRLRGLSCIFMYLLSRCINIHYYGCLQILRLLININLK